MVEERSGGKVNYYVVQVTKPNRMEAPYKAECGDIIESLGMTFSEGCAFKAIWRTAAARTHGLKKAGNDEKYDAEKIIFYGGRMLATATEWLPPKIVTTKAKPEPEPAKADNFGAYPD